MKNLPDGYIDIPPGKLASVVTALEMLSPPDHQEIRPADEWTLEIIKNPQTDWYRNLYRRIGEPWLWFSRLKMSEEELKAIITHSNISIYVFKFEGSEEGLLELDFRNPGECELTFIGLTEKLTGKGIGKWLMNKAIEFAWQKPIHRFWVHTCTLDGPGALSFYVRSGFRPFKRQIEIADDPRHVGVFPVKAAPGIPLL